MTPKTRNRILGASVILAILVWQVWLGYEVVTPPEIPMPDPQTIILQPGPVQTDAGDLGDPGQVDPGVAFDAAQLGQYHYSDPLTITGSLTNVRIIYYQLP